jgi:hypothetical protein
MVRIDRFAPSNQRVSLNAPSWDVGFDEALIGSAKSGPLFGSERSRCKFRNIKPL